MGKFDIHRFKLVFSALLINGVVISKGFGKDNGGAIPPNLLQFSNSESNGRYLDGCKMVGAQGHPARFPAKLPEFFIQFLTDPGDTVVDIFAGSNTTGEVAEREGRQWLSFEERIDYVAASVFRFLPTEVTDSQMRATYESVSAGESVEIDNGSRQQRLFA